MTRQKARNKSITNLKKKCILIVEDSSICAKVLQSFLESMGYSNLNVAPTGKEALKLLSSRSFDLVFLDLHLPDMSGIDFCHHYKKNYPQKNTPIICCSSSLAFISEKDLAKTCLEAGMDDFLHKPVSPEALQKIVNFWFSNK